MAKFRSIAMLALVAALFGSSPEALGFSSHLPAAGSPPGTGLPLAFERNDGQVDGAVDFLGRGPGYKVFLAADEVVTVFEHPGPDAASGVEPASATVLRMRLAGAHAAARPAPDDVLDYRTHYFMGESPSAHVRDVPSFARVRYPWIYPGIDVTYHSQRGFLEYDFHLLAGADPHAIGIEFDGADDIAISGDGELVLRVAGAQVTYRKPVAFQEAGGARSSVEVAYALAPDGRVGFTLGAYDASRPLVIDPILGYSSFFWGARAIAVDAQGNAFITGLTSSADLPAGSGFRSRLQGTADAFVVKLDPSGRQILYATYLGARRATTIGHGIAIDASGSAYVIGTTNGSAFPTTTGAYQRSYAPGASFVSKLNPTGSALLYSTFVNGASLTDIAVDDAGAAHITGRSGATGAFATTPGALQPDYGGCVIAKLEASGAAMAYATYFAQSGDGCSGIALGPAGEAYVGGTTAGAAFPTRNPMQPTIGGGTDAFAARLRADGGALVFSTYLGGSRDDYGNDIAVDSAGDAYLVGRTHSDNFPVSFAAFQPAKGYPGAEVSNGFVSKLTADGAALVYSSYLGGRWCLGSGAAVCIGSIDEGIDVATDVAVDAAGFAHVGGSTRSNGFPLEDALQGPPTGTEEERAPFVAKVRPAGNDLVYSVVVGPRRSGVEFGGLGLDTKGAAYAVGLGYSPDDPFPMTAGAPLAFNAGGVVFKLAPPAYPTTVRTSASPATAGQAVSFFADVAGGAPPGTVFFMEGDTVLGSAAVSNGTAVLTTTLLPGAHRITAVHTADDKESPPIYQVVTRE